MGGEHTPVKLTFLRGPLHQAKFVSVLFVVPKITAREEKAGQAPGQVSSDPHPLGISHSTSSHLIAIKSSHDEHRIQAAASCQRFSHFMLNVDKVV